MRPLAFGFFLSMFMGAAASMTLAQAPRFQPYGQGCAWSGQLCVIGNAGLPRVGRSFDITYVGPNSVGIVSQLGSVDIHPYLVFGFLSTLPAVPPPGLFPLQPGGCAGLVEPDAIVATPARIGLVPTPLYEPRITVPVPNNPDLRGSVFFTQWWTVVREVTTGVVTAIVTSDAAVIVVGA